MIPKREDILSYLTSHLKASRIAHSLGVEKTALHIAEEFSIDPRKVIAAALLHDAGKFPYIQEQIDFCHKNNIELQKEDLSAPGVIHSRISTWIARNEFGIEDPAILNAVLRHATGYPNMGTLEKIIFAADYLDPGRKFKHRGKLLKSLEKDFETTILTISIDKLQYVLKKPDYIHTDSLLFYNWQFHYITEASKN